MKGLLKGGTPCAHRAYYSFNYGPIHFLELDTETPYLPGSIQNQFVATDLAAVNRTLTPWIVVGMHRMMVRGCSLTHLHCYPRP